MSSLARTIAILILLLLLALIVSYTNSQYGTAAAIFVLAISSACSIVIGRFSKE